MKRLGFWRLVLIILAVITTVVSYWLLYLRGPQPIPPPGHPLQVDRPAAPARTTYAPRPTAASLRAAAKTANVIIVILDAARADHFSAYGYPRATTPNFDKLARESVLFEQHFCQYTQTSPSTATLFTGQYPDTHGVAVPRTGDKREPLRGLEANAYTLDYALAQAGLRTYLFTSTPASAPVLRLGANCQVIITPLGRVHSQADDDQWKSPAYLMDLIRRNLATDERCYAYIHFLPPHEPYLAPDDFTRLFTGQEAPGYFEAAPAFTRVYSRYHDQDPPTTGFDWVMLYDANLRWSDWALGEFIKYLKAREVYDHTLLIVTADHGEALGEHRYQWHVTCPYEEAIHIPLLIKLPGATHYVGQVNALTETIDVMPTILDLLGLCAPPNTVQGQSLLPLLTGEKTKPRDYIFCRTGGKYPCYVVQSHDWSLLLYQGGRMRALYDLRADPRQTNNVITAQPAQAEALAKVFADFALSQPFRPLDFLDPKAKTLASPASANMPMPEEAKRQLRSLGYLE